MAKCIRVELSIGSPTWTVVSQEGRIVEPVEEYLRFLRNRNDSPNTVRAYGTSLAQFWNYLERIDVKWIDVDLGQLAGFMDAVRFGEIDSNVFQFSAAPVVSESTVRLRVAAVQSFYRYFKRQGLEVAEFLPTEGARGHHYKPFLQGIGKARNPRRSPLRMALKTREVTVLRPDQVEALISGEDDPRYRLLWQLLSDSGLRLAEALMLQHRDWRLGAGSTAAVQVPDRQHPLGLRAKSGSRKVLVSEATDVLYTDLIEWLCSNGADFEIPDNQWDELFIFCNVYRGKRWGPLSPQSVYDHLERRKAHDSAIPQEMTPHWLRHTHATRLLLQGVRPLIVSRRLGHSSIQTTLDIYAHITELSEEEALEKLVEYEKRKEA